MTIPEDVRERLAAVQHEIWAHWMRYLFDVCETDDTRDGRVVIIPVDKVKRWQRQMNTPYVDLTDREQESDRHQADKILAAFAPVHWEPAPVGEKYDITDVFGRRVLYRMDEDTLAILTVDGNTVEKAEMLHLPADLRLFRRVVVTP